jgi:hypothetical protein
MKPDRYQSELIHAASLGDLKKVIDLVKSGTDLRYNDDLAMRKAALNGYTEIVRYLVSSGSLPCAMDDWAIRHATESGNFEMVKCLHDLGADLCVWDGFPVCLAARNGNIDIVSFAFYNYWDRLKRYDLFGNIFVYAAEADTTKIVEYMIQRGCPIRNGAFKAALNKSMNSKKYKTARYLISKKPEILKAKDDVTFLKKYDNLFCLESIDEIMNAINVMEVYES